MEATHRDCDGDLYCVDGDRAHIWNDDLQAWEVVPGGAAAARDFGLEPIYLRGGRNV